jgi:hypothetical protein
MDYYAAWPKSSVPKWAGIALGGIFTLIVVVCAGMIVHLVRPAKRVSLPIAAVALPQPKPVAPAPAPVAAAAPVAAPAPVAPVAKPAPVVAQAAKKHPAHAHKRAILAKHEGKSSRSSKDPIDRLLGL